MTRRLMEMNNPIELKVDGEPIRAYEGDTLAATLISEKGIGYRESKSGEARGPICNMGVCYECTVHVKGIGRVRACTTKAKHGMEVSTRFESFAGVSASAIANSGIPGSVVKSEKIDTIVPEASDEVAATREEKSKGSDDRKLNLYDVVIIGAGPAGMGAVDELAGHGLRVAVLDEQEQSGGQIYRQPPKEFGILGKGRELIDKVDKADIEWVHSAIVWGLLPKDQDGKTPTTPEKATFVEVCVEGKPSFLTRKVIIATGAYDRLLSIPGWELPGVMSAGGVQVFIKSQRMLPGEKIFLAGSHPFVFIVAQQILDHGGHVEGIAFSRGFPQVQEIFKYGTKSLKHSKKLKELLSAYGAIRKANVPIYYSCIPMEITGNQNEKKIKLAKVAKNYEIQMNDQLTVECDVIGMCYGFNASSELARQYGCEMYYDFDQGGWIAKHNDIMQSSHPAIFVAGEITGVGGAELSEAEGRLAGCGVAKLLGVGGSGIVARIRKHQKMKMSYDKFAEMLTEATAVPPSLFSKLLHKSETYVCKCEEVTIGEISDILAKHPHIESLNAVKLYSRCGMGPCQGRYCENTLTAYLKDKYPENANIHGNFNTRSPVKPISIRSLIRD